MPPDVVEHVLVWEVWYTHSHCSSAECPVALDVEESSKCWLYDTWAEAAAAIEKRITERPPGCHVDAIVDRISMPRAEWDRLEEVHA